MKKVTLLALAAVMTFSLAACSQTPAQPQTSDEPQTAEVNTEADVIVLGAGGAGMAAAITAKENGASVIVLEKMPMVGGNTLISGAEMAAPGNWLQAAEGIEDNAELMAQDMLTGGDHLNDPELVKVVADNALAGAEWLRDTCNVVWEDELMFFGGRLSVR